MSVLTILPFLISFTLGLLLVAQLDYKELRFNLIDKVCLSFGFGLGASSLMTFTSFLFLDGLNVFFIFMFHVCAFILLIILLKKNNINLLRYITDTTGINALDLAAVILIFLASIPLFLKASFYIHGGWDAWQVWNFKARFLFLGGEHWKNMFDPILWRSSPHYPLLLPCMTVWGWLFTGTTSYVIPQAISVLFAINTILFLYSSLKKTCSFLSSLVTCLAVLTLPLFSILAISQYSDLIFGFYLLLTGVLIVEAFKTGSFKLALLAGLSCGFMSFSKSEGLVSSFIIGGLLVFFVRIVLAKNLRINFLLLFFLGYLATAWSTLAFKALLSSKNISFINGFLSSEHPSTFFRLKRTLLLGFMEIGSPLTNFLQKIAGASTLQWDGLWIVFLTGILLAGKNIFNKITGIIPAFLAVYMTIVLVYYQMNTYFEINWWMSTTLHRILFALLPLALYWMVSSAGSKKN